nr:reverse transcriptase domain-containing protein [Tanacetum cinerariifolium]
MQTRSSSKLARDQTSNPTSSANPTPKGRIRRSSKQKVENSHSEENLTPVYTMTDNRTMAQMLRAPTEGLARNESSNPSASTNPNPKGRNRRRSKQRIENLDLDDLSEPVVTMADQRIMAQLLQAPTEGYEDAIVVPAITADNFELKHGLLTLVQNKQFFRHDKEDPHAHVR